MYTATTSDIDISDDDSFILQVVSDATRRPPLLTVSIVGEFDERLSLSLASWRRASVNDQMAGHRGSSLHIEGMNR